MNTQITTPANGKPNGVVVNGAAQAAATAALIALAKSKGMTSANVAMMRSLGADDAAISAKLNEMPDVNASVVTQPAATSAPLTMEQELASLRAENAALRQAKFVKQTLTCKVSEKGCMSVYGLGRMPVTLYSEQWERLLADVPKLQAFLKANVATLARKVR